MFVVRSGVTRPGDTDLWVTIDHDIGIPAGATPSTGDWWEWTSNLNNAFVWEREEDVVAFALTYDEYDLCIEEAVRLCVLNDQSTRRPTLGAT